MSMAESEKLPDLDRFGPDEAWWLGSALVDRCRSEDLAVTISIQLGEQRVFHAGLPGTSADNDSWAERKARSVTHFGVSSAAVFERYVASNPNFFQLFALSPNDYAPYPGAVPITVRGTLVGTLAISGLTGEQGHALAVEALHDEADFQADCQARTPPERSPSRSAWA